MGMVIIKLPLQLIHEMRTTIRSWKRKKKKKKKQKTKKVEDRNDDK